VGFIFDREGRDDELRKDLDRESRGLVTFTPRRMYENYLLNPHAIAVVNSKIKGFRTDGETSSEEVERWMGEQGSDAKYFGKSAEPPARTDPSWLTDVHGTRLLEDLFFDLSEARVTYEKVAHGVELTRWLCDNARDDLEDLAGLMVERLEQHERSTKESDA